MASQSTSVASTYNLRGSTLNVTPVESKKRNQSIDLPNTGRSSGKQTGKTSQAKRRKCNTEDLDTFANISSPSFDMKPKSGKKSNIPDHNSEQNQATLFTRRLRKPQMSRSDDPDNPDRNLLTPAPASGIEKKLKRRIRRTEELEAFVNCTPVSKMSQVAVSNVTKIKTRNFKDFMSPIHKFEPDIVAKRKVLQAKRNKNCKNRNIKKTEDTIKEIATKEVCLPFAEHVVLKTPNQECKPSNNGSTEKIDSSRLSLISNKNVAEDSSSNCHSRGLNMNITNSPIAVQENNFDANNQSVSQSVAAELQMFNQNTSCNTNLKEAVNSSPFEFEKTVNDAAILRDDHLLHASESDAQISTHAQQNNEACARSFELEKSVNDIAVLKKDFQLLVERAAPDKSKLNEFTEIETSEESKRNSASFELENTVNSIEKLENAALLSQHPTEGSGKNLAHEYPQKRSTFEKEDVINNINVLKRESRKSFGNSKKRPSNNWLDGSLKSVRPSSKVVKKKNSSEGKKSILKMLSIKLKSECDPRVVCSSEELDHVSPPWDKSDEDNFSDETAKYNTTRLSKTEPIIIHGDSSAECTPIKARVNLPSKKNPIIVISSAENTPSNGLTPLVKRNNLKTQSSLLKETLAKKWNVSLKESKDSITMNRGFRTKLPNFSQIHKKAFDQMEDIGSMTKRKEERAKLLLSGGKPSASSTAIKQRNVESPQRNPRENYPSTSKLQQGRVNDGSHTKKKLNFSNTVQSPTNKQTGTIDVDSPKTKSVVLQARAATSSKKVKFSTVDAVINNEPRAPSTPVTPKNISIKNRIKTPKFNHSNKENSNNKGFAKYGVNKVAAVSNIAQKQAVANKTKPANNKVQERRFEIKGVRTNRRFELLMEMRNRAA